VGLRQQFQLNCALLHLALLRLARFVIAFFPQMTGKQWQCEMVCIAVMNESRVRSPSDASNSPRGQWLFQLQFPVDERKAEALPHHPLHVCPGARFPGLRPACGGRGMSRKPSGWVWFREPFETDGVARFAPAMVGGASGRRRKVVWFRIFREPSFASAGMTVNYARIALASAGATVAYFAFGFAMFAALPAMKREFMKYPGVYRSEKAMMKVMPWGMVAILVSIIVVTVLYAKAYPAGGGIVSGATLGALIGLFAVCTFVIHNYVNLNIGLALTLYQGVTYFIQWVIVGAAIGLLYRPS
jgi:hypothetical protein